MATSLATKTIPSRIKRRKIATCAPALGQTVFNLEAQTSMVNSVDVRVNGQSQRPQSDFHVTEVISGAVHSDVVEWVSPDFSLAPTDYVEIEYDG